MLTYPQLIAIGAILSTHKPAFPHLLKAVEKEADNRRPATTENEDQCDKMKTQQNGPGGAGNTGTRGLTTEKEWL